MDIRKALSKFLRTVQGLNNKLPKNLDEAFEEVKKNASPSEPEWIWPPHHEVESEEALVEQGWLIRIISRHYCLNGLGQYIVWKNFHLLKAICAPPPGPLSMQAGVKMQTRIKQHRYNLQSKLKIINLWQYFI